MKLRGFSKEQDLEVTRAVKNVVRSGIYVLGPMVEKFENEWAHYVGAKHCVALGSGLSALQLGLRALGVRPGHEVLVPERTFIATWMAVSSLGATPIPVRTERGGSNFDISKIPELISDKTAAIIPVHLYGHPVDLIALGQISKEFGVPILEDAAQAHGAEFEGKKIGSHGNLVAWSFYPGKNLGALGDAGALTTDSTDQAFELRLLRNYGSSEKYIHEIIGDNSRLDEIHAAVLSAKLKFLDANNKKRASVARKYVDKFEKLQRSEVVQDLRRIIDEESSGSIRSAWHVFTLSVNKNAAELRSRLLKEGIQTSSHYPVWPQSQAPYSKIPYPISSSKDSEIVSLPIGPHLSLSDCDRVAEKTVKIASDINAFS